MAMNFWATIEHSLQYKYKGDMPEHVAERLSKAADAINALDQKKTAFFDHNDPKWWNGSRKLPLNSEAKP